VRYLVAAPTLIQKYPIAKEPSDLKSWPWATLSGAQFGGSKEVALYSIKNAEHAFRISPVLISEGVTSLREAVLAGLGIAVLPDWLIREGVVSGKLVRVLPKWNG
jgi:DNA-binding transcriptional LysR family regulator